MEPITLPKTFDGLVDVVEDLADQIAGGEFPDFEGAHEAETQLRADLAAATYANQAYLAAFAEKGKSALAHRFLAETWYKRSRAHVRLRQDAQAVLDDLFPPYLDELFGEEDDELVPV